MDAITVWLLVLVALPLLLFFCRILLMGWKSILLSKRIKALSNNVNVPCWPSVAMAYNFSSNWNGTLPIIVNPVPPVVFYPTAPPSSDYYNYDYDLYTYIVVLFVLALIISLTKVAVNRRRARQTALRNARACWPSMAMTYNISSNGNGTLPIIVNPSVVFYPTPSPSSDYYNYDYDLYTYVGVLFVLVLMLGLTMAVLKRRRARQSTLRNARARQGHVATVSGSVDSNQVNQPDTATTSPTASVENTKVDLPPTYDEVMKVFLEAKERTAAAPSSETTCTAVQETRTSSAAPIDIDEPPSPPPQYCIV